MKLTTMVRDSVKVAREKLSDGHAALAATDLLEEQHREVELLFARIERSRDGRAKRTLVQELATKLSAHMVIEQEIFYPAARRESDQKDMVIESFEEHAVARFELERLLATATTDDSFDAHVKVLKELIGHHVEEEEDTLFPRANKKMDRARRAALGTEMHVRFNALVERGLDAALRASKSVTTARARAAKRTTSRHAGTTTHASAKRATR